MKAIFRVENQYDCCDYDTLNETKRNSENGDYIKFSYDYMDFSRVKRKYANKFWATKCSHKYGFSFDL